MFNDYLCNNDYFALICGNKYEQIMKKMRRILKAQNNKIFVYPIDIVESLCNYKYGLIKEDKFEIFNLSTYFNVNVLEDLEMINIVKKIFREIFKYKVNCINSFYDISLKFNDMCQLYHGYKNNINSGLENLDTILYNIFNEKEIVILSKM